MADDEDQFPYTATCSNHLKPHAFIVRDEYDQAIITVLSLQGWIGLGSGYCPGYFPSFLGYEPLPAVEAANERGDA